MWCKNVTHRKQDVVNKDIQRIFHRSINNYRKENVLKNILTH